MKPERLEHISTDGSKLSLDALFRIAPSCFTEVKDDKTGAVKHVVNFKTLRQLLGDDAVEDTEEMYQFTWPGKQAARREAAATITDTLRPVPEDSVDWDTTENLYIEGDNLRVLKLLQRGYMGKVKMIYIDPPYNTGNDFVYHDDYAVDSKQWLVDSGDRDAEGYRYRKNLDSNGRFHSDWCSMMYSRLLVARSLLTEDGVIFISIDDNEVHNLRKVCDEVFGEGNFVAEYKWNKTSTPPSLSNKIRGKYEYILCYEKQLSNIMYNGGVIEGGDMPLLNEGNAIRTIRFPKNSLTFNIQGSFPTGEYDRVFLEKKINVIEGRSDKDIMLTGPFKWTQNTVDDEIANGTTFIIRAINLLFVIYVQERE